MTTQRATPRSVDLEWVLVVLHEGVAQRHALPSGEAVIGRGDDCAIVLDHPSVSRQHLRLGVGRELVVEELGSSNGTRVQGAPLPPGQRRAVAEGATLEIGDLFTVVRRLPRVATTAPPGVGVLETDGLRSLFQIVDRAAPSDLPVLILGETGVGKEHVAERIVARSPRAARPFLRVNVAALSATVIESELFGHERGAFTGADKRKPGLFELATTGTVFLDEIGDLSLPLQAKLLRVLEEASVWPVGAVRPVPIDVRVVTATHPGLLLAVDEGRFRRDLYYRLCGVRLEIPPLRARRQDEEPLARFFVARCAATLGLAAPPPLTSAALAAIAAHAWPGNVRELRFACERAVVLAGGAPIEPAHLQLEAAPAAAPDAPLAPAPAVATAEAERARIVKALEECAGNQTQAARLLGISRGTLVSRLEAFGLPRPRRR